MPAAASKDRYKCERALFSKCLAVREQLDSPSSPPLGTIAGFRPYQSHLPRNLRDCMFVASAGGKLTIF